MNRNETYIIFQELLRVGLISARNLSFEKKVTTQNRRKLKDWLELCHTIPSILLGECSAEAVKYFLNVGSVQFLDNYPKKEDADYLQITELIEELRKIQRV